MAPREDVLAALGPPAAEQAFDVLGRRVGRRPRGRWGSRRERAVDQGAGERLDVDPGGGVGEHDGADALPVLGVGHDAGDEPGHATGVSMRDALTAAVQHQPQPPRERPAVEVGDHLRVPHLGEDVRGQRRRVGIGEERGPAAEVGGGAPELRRRRHAPQREQRLQPRRVAVRLHEVAARSRLDRLGGGPVHAERLEQALAEDHLPRAPGSRGDHLAEQREGEVRVVPAPPGLEHLSGVCDPGDHLVAIRVLERLPDLPASPGVRLAAQPGKVREHPPQRGVPVRDAGQVLVETILEVELAGVAQLQHQHGGEALGDRSDRVLGVERWRPPPFDVSQPDRIGPGHGAVADHCGGDARRAGLALELAQAPAAVLLEGVEGGGLHAHASGGLRTGGQTSMGKP